MMSCRGLFWACRVDDGHHGGRSDSGGRGGSVQTRPGGKVSSTTARELDSLAAAIEACWAMVPEAGRRNLLQRRCTFGSLGFLEIFC